MNSQLRQLLNFSIENWPAHKKVTLHSQQLFSLSFSLIKVVLATNLTTQRERSFVDEVRSALAELGVNLTGSFSNSLNSNSSRSLEINEQNYLVFVSQWGESKLFDNKPFLNNVTTEEAKLDTTEFDHLWLTYSSQLGEENGEADHKTWELCEELTLVTHRAALKANDILDWLSLGKVFDPWVGAPSDFLPNSFETQSLKGLGVKVEIPCSPMSESTPPFVFQTSSDGIPTNFAEGDYILFTGFIPGGFPAVGNPGPLTIIFDQPVKGAGTQLAVDDTFNFTIFVEAFDSENDSLGLFALPGTASAEVDNSAQFVGVLSEEANIKKLVYGYSTATPPEFTPSSEHRAFGINQLSIVTPDQLWESEELLIEDDDDLLALMEFNAVEENISQNSLDKYVDNYFSSGSLVNKCQDNLCHDELINTCNLKTEDVLFSQTISM